MQEQYQLLREVSRTFALSIERLPGEVRDALTLAYLLFRVSDFLEDNIFMPADRKAGLLLLWAEVLQGNRSVADLLAELRDIDEDDPEARVAVQADLLLAQVTNLPAGVRGPLMARVAESTRGMARWQLKGPLVRTEEEMDDYMYHVAGLVGYVVTDVFGYYSPMIRPLRARLLPLARDFGLGLQTVNVIRGLRKDFDRGWVFVPASYCEVVGLGQQELFDPARRGAALQVVEMLSRKAEGHLANGLEYVTMLPRSSYRMRLACAWPLLLAARTLAVSRGNPRVLSDEAKISRKRVRQILLVSYLIGWSNTALRWYYRQLTRPAHTSR